jgi:hypothetical protein
MQWIKLKTIERPFYDPRTGKVLSSIEGRRNRPGKDPFQGGGKVYPDLSGVTVHARYEAGTTFMVLVEGDVDKLKAMSGKATYKASPKETREYDLKDFAPTELDKTAALKALKEEIKLDIDELDKDGKPVFKEKEIVR